MGGIREPGAHHNIPVGKRRGEVGEVIMSERQSLLVEVRRLWPSDTESFRDHLLRLDARSRQKRFCGGMADNFIVKYANNCFGTGDLLYGAFVDGHLYGAAELRSNHAIWIELPPFGRHIHAEAAFSVEEEYRRHGIGEMLFGRVKRAASNHGVETIDIVCQADNIGMRRLAQKFQTELTFQGSSLTGHLIARRPTPFSLVREASGDIVDFGHALFDAQWRALMHPQETGASNQRRPAIPF
jgi:GNAT superfamily N-acetyltransferase